MKMLIFIFAIFFIGIYAGPPLPPTTRRTTEVVHDRLLGSKECTWGPSYWCQNLTSAASCHATKHCIQTDWIHRKLAPDTSNICQTCLEMVKEARDNLLSNETQDLIKQVFEGTCALVHFKPIVQECDKIVDNFIPDLIDTLASEMNPQVVCSVAGLCNNEKYLKTVQNDEGSTLKPVVKMDQCKGCRTVMTIVEKRFDSMSKDNVLQGFLMMCREMDSFSDACSNIILTYFTDIYDHLKEHLNPSEVCILSGQCSALFHKHDTPHEKNIEITPISDIGYVQVSGDPDPGLPCDLCQQLVKHLRDLLTANTTEEEFKQVLEGLCKQTKSFSDECLQIVDQYYGEAYKYLLSELNGTVVCGMIGICPNLNNFKDVQIAPLVPSGTLDVLQISPKITKKTVNNLARVPLTKSSPAVQIISKGFENPETAQLPIDFLNSPFEQVMFNKEVCEFCQFFLHYVQQELTSDATEDEIRKVIEKACDKLPSSLNETCDNFVETYEPALVALLAQEIDPAQICPLIKACPSDDVKDVDIFMEADAKDNTKCPLCLFAVQKLEEMVKDKKTEADIKDALDRLCSKLSENLAKECQNFVDTYSDELVEMLLADLNPKEVCVYLKLCTDNKPAPSVLQPISKPFVQVGEPETNSILDNTFNGIDVNVKKSNNLDGIRSAECVLCKLVMNEVNKMMLDNKTEIAIETALDNVCDILPEAIRNDCRQFVDQYGHTVFNLLKIVTVPADICPMMQLCGTHRLDDDVKVDIFDCPVCEAAVWAMEKILANPKVDHEMKHVLEKTCRALPSRDQAKCREIIEKYGTEIFDLIEHMANKQLICRKIGICTAGNKVLIV